MKRLAILFIAIVGILPFVRGEESPSPGTVGVNASGALLSRDAVVPLTVVTRFFPEATGFDCVEMSAASINHW
jgi:hypothetical protein